jgi:plastocyanin
MESCNRNRRVGGKHVQRVRMAAVTFALLFIPLAMSSTTEAVGSATVVVNGGLAPNILTVQVGTTVTWQLNDADKHRMRSLSGPVQFDSGGLDPGSSYSFTFDTLGTVNYGDDENKNLAAYSGSIVVVDAVPTPTPAPTTAPSAPGAPGTPAPAPAPSTVTVRIANRAFSPT